MAVQLSSDSLRMIVIKRLARFIFRSIAIGLLLIIPSLIIVIFQLNSNSLPPFNETFTPILSDRHGNALQTWHQSMVKQAIQLDQIAPSFVQATLAIEDRRFYSHPGIDWRGFLRALFVNVKHGEMRQGGSTITQQLARNLFLTQEKTWTRKLSEAKLAVQLEQKWSKQKILELYLNQIYYGHGAYGVESAARYYFNKSAQELNLAEAAMLAGIPKSPNYYSPDRNWAAAKKRQANVLDAMVAANMISSADKEAALQQKMSIRDDVATTPRSSQYFHDATIKEMKHIIPTIANQAHRVQTTLDPQMQKSAEAVIREVLGPSDPKKDQLEVALIALDPRSGAIRAMVGGRDYQKSAFNRVFTKTRQPGSTFKPFVYLTALEQNWTPVTRLRSEPTIFSFDKGKRTYTPSNYDHRYSFEEITMRTALAQSDNIYAVKTIMAVGPEQVITTARRLGIHSELQAVPSLALGTFPISPLEMVKAYATIANHGTAIKPYAIEKIFSLNNELLYQAQKNVSDPVVGVAESYVLSKMMESVLEPGGTAFRVSNWLKRPVAAKTGTTKSDAWMIGFSPDLAVAVWVGYDHGKALKVDEARKAAPIFAKFFEKALAGVPPKLFDTPMDVVSVSVDQNSGQLASTNCNGPTVFESFVKGTEPLQRCGQNSAIPLSPQTQNQQQSKQTNESEWLKTMKRWWMQ